MKNYSLVSATNDVFSINITNVPETLVKNWIQHLIDKHADSHGDKAYCVVNKLFDEWHVYHGCKDKHYTIREEGSKLVVSVQYYNLVKG